MSKSTEQHRFTPNPGTGKYENYVNHQECGYCRMPRTHRVHPQADRGAIGHRGGTDDYTSCYTASHWAKPILTNEG